MEDLNSEKVPEKNKSWTTFYKKNEREFGHGRIPDGGEHVGRWRVHLVSGQQSSCSGCSSSGGGGGSSSGRARHTDGHWSGCRNGHTCQCCRQTTKVSREDIGIAYTQHDDDSSWLFFLFQSRDSTKSKSFDNGWARDINKENDNFPQSMFKQPQWITWRGGRTGGGERNVERGETRGVLQWRLGHRQHGRCENKSSTVRTILLPVNTPWPHLARNRNGYVTK